MAKAEPTARQRLDAERARLAALREDVAERVADEQASRGEELSHLDQHPAEQGTETEDLETALSLLEQLDGELADLDDAYARLEAGTYGRCEVCGRQIDEARLEALPAARRCTEHQVAAETSRGPVA